MKNFLLSIFFILALTIGAIGQTTLVDFETVADPWLDPFDLTSTEIVANPDATVNTSATVAKVVKGAAFWGGINIDLGGELVFSGTNDQVLIDFYTESIFNDTIVFTLQLFNRDDAAVTTIQKDTFYIYAGDTEVGVWKTLAFDIPDGTTAAINKMVIFFGWANIVEGDIVYFDNIVAPGYTAYGNTDVTFNITDKFNNATDVGLFIDGTASTLTQTDNVYSVTESLASYNITLGEGTGIYEIVYTHMANGAEVRDTTSLTCGNAAGAQELLQLIIVEDIEDGTALAISVGDTPPTIDGTIDDVWDNAKTHTMQERSWWGSPTGMYSTWKIMWDIDNVYLLYTVEDATPINDNAVDAYKNDCVEAFFDMNQSASADYDSDDWQIRTVRGLDTWTGSAGVDATWAADFERGQSEVTSPDGYVIEMAIPWLSLSSAFLPIAGTEFNYDCATADVTASGGTRIFRESWTTAVDNAYNNTEAFGTITLSALTDENAATSIRDIMKIENLSVYPNPAVDQLHIQAGTEISSVEVFDITGRRASIATNINKKAVSMDVNHLDKNAIYIVRITDVKGNISSKRINVL